MRVEGWVSGFVCSIFSIPTLAFLGHRVISFSSRDCTGPLKCAPFCWGVTEVDLRVHVPSWMGSLQI